MPDTSGKTNINVQEVKFIPIIDEDAGTYDTTNAVDLTDRARSVTYTPTVKKAPLYGDGVIQEEVIDAETGDFALNVNYLTDDDRKVMFGETQSNGSNVVTGDEQPPAGIVIFKTLCKKDGSVINLYKFFAVTFEPAEETVTQIEDGVTYSTVQIKGKYRKNKHNKAVYATRRHVVPTATGASTIIESWYATPEYVGPTG